MDNKQIGEIIKEARKSHGLTQKQLAEIVGCATGTIQQYELGKRQPRLEQITKIAIVLEIQFHELLDYSSFPSDNDLNNVIRDLSDNKEFKKLDFFESITDYSIFPDITIIAESFQILNETGRKEAKKRIEELTKISDYTN